VRVGQGSSIFQEHLHVILKNASTHAEVHCIWFIKKWEGREGEFAWIFLKDKLYRFYHNLGKLTYIKAWAWLLNQEISGKMSIFRVCLLDRSITRIVNITCVPLRIHSHIQDKLLYASLFSATETCDTRIAPPASLKPEDKKCISQRVKILQIASIFQKPVCALQNNGYGFLLIFSITCWKCKDIVKLHPKYTKKTFDNSAIYSK
jgi:hypothetical protein